MSKGNEIILNRNFETINQLNQTIQALWQDYREAVKVHGYDSAETKQVLIKIYDLEDTWHKHQALTLTG
ncbi:hypothetical protein [Paenibacillus sp. Soil787]|uniref:hypothetical protein n=1 Tax=Paenibacillus sp. Soil787 TaxID=1736411 RepID=UPI000702B67C|nr:hypothetical protein [Paenibacillus sp. Soil787]KRF10758.1 hypothetical protein ASG93_17660 [Paenibacillus sp. Soil787]